MVKNCSNFKNPLIIASVILAILTYSGLLKTKNPYVFNSLFEFQDIVKLDGEICSNQKKLTSGKYYSTDLKVKNSYTSKGFSSACTGKIKMMIPASCVEAYMPGKLYSSAYDTNAIICENGYSVSVSGFFGKDNIFIVKNAVQLESQDDFRSKFQKFRGKCRINFRRIMYSWGEAGGLLLALLSGIREYTDEKVADAFKLAGLSHILALSGMHLSLFSGIAKKIGNAFSSVIFSSIIQIFSVLIFVWFAGISPSLFRALICSLTIILCNLLCVKKIKLTSVLAFSFLIHFILRPEDVHELAFKLSYGALAGILVSGNFFRVFTAAKLPSALSESISASAGAQTFTAPVSIGSMGCFIPVGIISAVIVSPLINIFIYSGLILMILCFFIPVTVPVASFYMKILYNIIKYIVLLFSGVPCFNFN